MGWGGLCGGLSGSERKGAEENAGHSWEGVYPEEKGSIRGANKPRRNEGKKERENYGLWTAQANKDESSAKP